MTHVRSRKSRPGPRRDLPWGVPVFVSVEHKALGIARNRAAPRTSPTPGPRPAVPQRAARALASLQAQSFRVQSGDRRHGGQCPSPGAHCWETPTRGIPASPPKPAPAGDQSPPDADLPGPSRATGPSPLDQGVKVMWIELERFDEAVPPTTSRNHAWKYQSSPTAAATVPLAWGRRSG